MLRCGPPKRINDQGEESEPEQDEDSYQENEYNEYVKQVRKVDAKTGLEQLEKFENGFCIESSEVDWHIHLAQQRWYQEG